MPSQIYQIQTTPSQTFADLQGMMTIYLVTNYIKFSFCPCIVLLPNVWSRSQVLRVTLAIF